MTPARAAPVVADVVIGHTGQFDTEIGRELHSDRELAVRTINEWAQARLAAQPRPNRQPRSDEGAARTREGVAGLPDRADPPPRGQPLERARRPTGGGDEVTQAHDHLYAVARGSLCTEFGPPIGDEEKALDALAASLVTSRGTNGAGLGWDPPEPDLLRQAGQELQRSPERLQDLVNRVATVERALYPAWPNRERLVLDRHPDHDRRTDDREPLDRERGRYQQEVERWREEAERDRGHRRPRKDRQPDKDRKPEVELPGTESNPEPVELPGRDWRGPGEEPPAPERAPTPNREIPREHDRNGPAR